MSKFEFFKPYRDKVTGFTGVCTARIEYSTGCRQVALQSREMKDGKPMDPVWFDEQKLEPTGTIAGVQIDNGETRGADFAPPSFQG